jgi:hypothetical protein
VALTSHLALCISLSRYFMMRAVEVNRNGRMVTFSQFFLLTTELSFPRNFFQLRLRWLVLCIPRTEPVLLILTLRSFSSSIAHFPSPSFYTYNLYTQFFIFRTRTHEFSFWNLYAQFIHIIFHFWNLYTTYMKKFVK